MFFDPTNKFPHWATMAAKRKLKGVLIAIALLSTIVYFWIVHLHWLAPKFHWETVKIIIKSSDISSESHSTDNSVSLIRNVNPISKGNSTNIISLQLAVQNVTHHVTANVTAEIATEARPIPLIFLSYAYTEPKFHPTSITTLKGKECATTMDNARQRDSDAVVIRFSQVFNRAQLPDSSLRRPEQVFVFMCQEPTWPFRHKDYRNVDKNYFNWTMTYHRDADVYFPYGAQGRIFGREDQRPYYGENVVKSILRKKSTSRIALAAISRCSEDLGPAYRLKYVAALESHGLAMKKLGGCFNGFRDGAWYEDGFREMASSYKFFLAFENGFHCRDYITEKSWNNAIRSGTVPVILGAPKGDVTKVLPRGSFVHTDDFAGPAQLAEHLMYLNKNTTAYAEYLAWRLRPTKASLNDQDFDYDLLCNKLWDLRKKPQTKVYTSFKQWFLGGENKECLTPPKPEW